MLTRSVRTCRLCGTALQAQRAAATSSFSLLASRRQLAAASPSLVASFHSSRELSRREATGPRGVRKRHPPPSPVHRPHPRSSDVRAPAKPAVEEEELAPTEEQTAIVELKDIPVHVPDDPNGVLDLARGSAAERARQMLAQPALVVVRQIEMLNLFVGWEQANKYKIMAPDGTELGYLLEEGEGFGKSLSRQVLNTHRPFRATVLDLQGNVVLKISRPFSWINSRISVSVPSDEPDTPDDVIGETQQRWHVYRRKYEHFISRDGDMTQFAETNMGLLAWDFNITDAHGQTLASINRNFAGLARELFTDTGHYVLRFEGVVQDYQAIEPPAPRGLLTAPQDTTSSSEKKELARTEESSSGERSVVRAREAEPTPPSLPFDQRAVLLATAVSIDFDYFTRDRGSGLGGFMPMPIFFPGSPAPEAGGAPAPTGEGGGAAPPPPPAAGSGGDTVPGYEYGDDSGSGEQLPREQTGDSSEGGGSMDPDRGGWSDEVMDDPWATQDTPDEPGGTWSWGDLFPGDDD